MAAGAVQLLKSFVGFGPGKHEGTPPPPSATNPYKLIERRKYGGSAGEDGALPPPRPAGPAPRSVPRELFDDADKCTYEVQYHKVYVRAGPSLRAPAVGVKCKGDIVEVEQENRHWVKIKPEGRAPGGWMLRFQKSYGPLLQLVEVERWAEYTTVRERRKESVKQCLTLRLLRMFAVGSQVSARS